jgi:predicted DNA-binding transcriptional regulator YafY
MPTDTKTHRILRLILLLSNSYPKTKEECIAFLEIKSSAFYNYCNLLKDTGFDLQQHDGKYWINFQDKDHQVLGNLLHFTEEESYMLSRSIDSFEGNPGHVAILKQKLVSFLNQDKAIEAYINKEKSVIVQALRKAQKQKKQILLINYASGNSQTVKNRMVEPFEFKDDFNLVWAFDTGLKRNRQFKICRIEDISETLIGWEYGSSHRSLPVDIFHNTGELDKKVEFELNLRAKNLLVEEYPLSGKYLTTISQNRFVFKAPVAKYEGPGRFVLGIAEDIQLIGDEGFREFVKLKINKCQNIL